MSEAKRIEGQMFLKGGVGWVVAVVLLLIAAGGTLVAGYVVNRWVSFTASAGMSALTGGATGGTGAAGGGAWAGAMTGLPVSAGVSVKSVSWPVQPGGTFAAHWANRQAGVGTMNTWYMDSAAAQGWQWSSSVSIPVPKEDTYVIVVSIPRGIEPAEATGGQLWVCELGQTGNGDIMPVESTVRVCSQLTQAQIKSLWDNDFPAGLQDDLIDAARGIGPLAGKATGTRTGYGYPFTPIDAYFTTAKPTDESGEGEREEPGEPDSGQTP
jgi:hypothetical protein